MKTTKTNQIGDWYKKFRGVGYPALQALREAKVMHEFKILENQGLVSLSKEHETESYFDVYGKPETKNQEREIIEYYTKEDGAPLKEVSKIERALVYGNSLGEKEAKDEYDWKPITREEFEEIRRQALILFNNPLSIKKTIEIEVSY